MILHIHTIITWAAPSLTGLVREHDVLRFQTSPILLSNLTYYVSKHHLLSLQT